MSLFLPERFTYHEKYTLSEDDLYRYLPKFESIDESEYESLQRQKTLKEYDTKESMLLFYKLNSCIEDEPCNSPACPVCVRRNRIKYIESCMDFVDIFNWKLLTIINYGDVCQGKDILDLNIKKLGDQLRYILSEEPEIKMAIGCFEIEFNQESESWIPHFHLLIKTNDESLKKLRSLIRKSSKLTIEPGDVKIKRPVRVDDIYDLLPLIAYIYKIMWRKKPYYEGMQSSNPRKVRIRGELGVYALLMLDSLTFKSLELRYGITRNKDGLKKSVHRI